MSLLAKLHDLLLVDFFDGYSGPCGNLSRQQDTPIGALAEDLAQFVLIEGGGAWRRAPARWCCFYH